MAYGLPNFQNDMLEIGTVRDDGKVLSSQFVPEESASDDKMFGYAGSRYAGGAAYAGGYGYAGGYPGGYPAGGYPRPIQRPRPIRRPLPMPRQTMCAGQNCEKKCQFSYFARSEVCDCWCTRM